jgi:uncharacterized membrane protein YecN with MAPEG domain
MGGRLRVDATYAQPCATRAHICGWTLVVGALFPLGAAFRPRSHFFRLGFAVTFVVLAIALFALRDSGPALGNAPSIARGDSRS